MSPSDPIGRGDVTVRPLTRADRAAWSPLFAEYVRFYRATLPPEVVDGTFARLTERSLGMAGFGAELGGELVGFAHVVEHASTWAAEPVLYLEDLFVSPAVRGGGVGRSLIAAVYAEADARGCSKTYWITEEFNAAARRTYETVARRMSYITYER